MTETRDTDVVVVGSGCAGLTAALTARAAGLDVIVVEKAIQFGGTSAISGGGSWIPDAPVKRRAGLSDDAADALAYLKKIVGNGASVARQARYIEAAPQMMAFLESNSPYLANGFFWAGGLPDYHPALGGSTQGRGVWPVPIDRRRLGPLEPTLRTGWSRVRGMPKGMWLTSVDLHDIVRIRWRKSGSKPYRAFVRLVWRMVKSRLFGQKMATSGAALMARLRLALRDADVPLLLETPMRRLNIDPDGRVTGIQAERGGQVITINARRGVILASGGLEHGGDARSVYQPVVGAGWSLGSPDNVGEGQVAAADIGAQLDLMDDAWWYPVIALPQGMSGIAVERKLAGMFIVNADGERFANEAADYITFGKILLARQAAQGGHIPVWMIIDEQCWTHNLICGHFPVGPMPREWLESGHVKKAASLEALALAIGVPPEKLKDTATRFNGFARSGVDEDFHRGENAYDNYLADPSRENPNLAPVDTPPFYAFQIFPGDLGTKGGVVTDEDGRALRDDGSIIPRLYAAGNVSAAVMGRSYAGPGSTIGPAMTFAWLAARHIAQDTAA